MTRLRTGDLSNIAKTLNRYDTELVRKTARTLRQIACGAAGIDEKEVYRTQKSYGVAVIPLTSGRGIIKGFAQTVEAIVRHLGFPAFTTEETDVSGLGEAFAMGAEILMLADDRSFLAIHPSQKKVVDNAEATGKGFATALDRMTNGLRGKEVLLIGAGRVGRSAALSMVGMGAHLSIYDWDRGRSERLAREMKGVLKCEVKVEPDVHEALFRHRIYFDASPSPEFIRSKHITSETFIAAPGLPLGLSPGARRRVSERLLHDPLQIGVATMIVDVAYGPKKKILP